MIHMHPGSAELSVAWDLTVAIMKMETAQLPRVDLT